MKDDDMLEELADLGDDLNYAHIRHLTDDQKEVLAEKMKVDVSQLPTLKNEEREEMAGEIDAELRNKSAEAKRKYEEERFDNQK